MTKGEYKQMNKLKVASDVFESYSAGTELRPQINQDAVRIIKDLHSHTPRSLGVFF